MVVYLINISLIIVYGFLLQNQSHYAAEARKKMYGFLVMTQFILLSALRADSIGADTTNYVENYDIVVRQWSWSHLWELFGASFKNSYDIRDVGYWIFAKATQVVIPDSRWYLLLTAVLVMVPFGIWIIKYSSDQCLSYVTFACLFFSFFGLTGIRQALAVVMVSLIGFELILERKLVRYVIVILIAMTFHKTAIIALPFYFLYNFHLKKIYRWIAAVGIALCFLFKNQIAILLNYVGGYHYEQYEGAGTYMFTLLMFVVLAVSFLWYDKLTEENQNVKYYINALVCGCFILPLSYIDPTFLRLGYYYNIFLILLLPELLRVFKEKRLVKLIMMGILILAFIKSGERYCFFWQ